jgi:hypothetical protein
VKTFVGIAERLESKTDYLRLRKGDAALLNIQTLPNGQRTPI